MEEKFYKSITAIDKETGAICTLTCEVRCPKFDLAWAVKSATKDFLDTKEGKEFLESKGYFSLGEFKEYIPEELCDKYNFKVLNVIQVDIIGWDENLVNLN